MEREEKKVTLAEYIGISGPEAPKYLLTNNFLVNFFGFDRDETKAIGHQDFAGILYTEEGDEEKREKIFASFDRFFDCFSGRELLKPKNKSKRVTYFPMVKPLLRNSPHHLRELLFTLLDLSEDDYVQMRGKLDNYLFQQRSGTNYILTRLCGKLTASQGAETGKRGSGRNYHLSKADFKELGQHLRNDLEVLMQHESFLKLDFYKRYEYLSILLTFYVIQFILYRCEKKQRFIFCKGFDKNSGLMSGEIHKACTRNYSEIRNVFLKLQGSYYEEKLQNVEDERLTVHYEDGNITVNGQDFIGYINELFDVKFQNKPESIESVKRYFGVNEEQTQAEYQKDEFYDRFLVFAQKKKGSNFVKISSALPTSGREIGFVFPKSHTKFKYFAMSRELLEFFVRLYLAGIQEEYDYLDNFIQHLEKRYHIYMVKSDKIDKYLNAYQMKITAGEFRKNEDALLDNLRESNCLIKLSDSGYVVTLPEKKGEFKLL